MCVRLSRWLAIAISLIAAGSARADFVAYFDHSRGAGTHFNTLSFLVNTPVSTGFLTNAADGVTTPVFVIATTNGAMTSGGTSAEPAAGTPAYATFNGFVTFGSTANSALQVPLNITMTYTFSNLNPNAHYIFKGTAVRGGSGSNYSNRWTKVSIVGADSFTSNHTANVVVNSQAPADLLPNEAAFQSGLNNLAGQGDVIEWDDIAPGADGMFQIVSTRYAGAVPPPNSTTLNSPPYGYAISGFRLEEIAGAPDPIVITSGPTPSSETILQGQTAQFQVTVTGTAPRYQWFRTDGQAIQHAVNTNTSVLVITNAQPTDTAIYRVRVTNVVNSVTSGPANLTVNPDNDPPTLVKALGLADGTNVLVSFSEPLDTANPPNPAAFHVHLTGGGGILTVITAVFTNGTNVLIATDTPRTANVNYSLGVDANAVSDVSGNAFAGAEVPMSVEVRLIAFEGTQWKYNTEGRDLGADWRNDPGYDETANNFLDGVSVFDGKTPQPPGRATIAGFPVMTQLFLTNTTTFTMTTTDIPAYYFRYHFNLATDPAQVSSLRLRTLSDDHDVCWFNNYDTPGHQRTGIMTNVDAFGYDGGATVGDAAVEGPFSINPTNLVYGDNLVAAKEFQGTAGSSDITFAYDLVAVVARFLVPIRIAVSYSGGQVHLSWNDTTMNLYQADTANATGAAWTLVAGQAAGSANVAVGGAGAKKFFTLRR